MVIIFKSSYLYWTRFFFSNSNATGHAIRACVDMGVYEATGNWKKKTQVLN